MDQHRVERLYRVYVLFGRQRRLYITTARDAQRAKATVLHLVSADATEDQTPYHVTRIDRVRASATRVR